MKTGSDATRWWLQTRKGWVWVTAESATRCSVAGLHVRLASETPEGAERPLSGRVWRSRAEFRAPQPDHVGPNGRKACRWCHREVPKGKRTWCGDACVRAYKEVSDWGYVRAAVERRDAGICGECGMDTERLRRILRKTKVGIGYGGRVYFGVDIAVNRDVLVAIGMTEAEVGRSLWEADHIRARNEGGEDRLDNLRTLCVVCHRAHTAQQRSRWAKGK